MKNGFSVYSSPEGIKKIIESSINSCDIMLEHYQFVINDISSEINNPKLEATKGPSIEFLKSMELEWINFRKSLVSQLNEL